MASADVDVIVKSAGAFRGQLVEAAAAIAKASRATPWFAASAHESPDWLERYKESETLAAMTEACFRLSPPRVRRPDNFLLFAALAVGLVSATLLVAVIVASLPEAV